MLCDQLPLCSAVLASIQTQSCVFKQHATLFCSLHFHHPSSCSHDLVGTPFLGSISTCIGVSHHRSTLCLGFNACYTLTTYSALSSTRGQWPNIISIIHQVILTTWSEPFSLAQSQPVLVFQPQVNCMSWDQCLLYTNHLLSSLTYQRMTT